jgi:hypothetical protein
MRIQQGLKGREPHAHRNDGGRCGVRSATSALRSE